MDATTRGVITFVKVAIWVMLLGPVIAHAGIHLPLNEGHGNEGPGSTATDIDGEADQAALVGNPVYDTDTPSGQGFSLRFDGTDDRIDFGVIEAGPSGLTLAAWVKADAFPGRIRDPRIISKADGVAANDHVFLLGTIAAQSRTRPVFRLRVNGVTRTVRGSAAANIVTGQWYHLAATYDGSAMRLYLDGVLVGSRSISGTIDIDPAVAATAGSQPDGTKLWNGLLDDIRIFQQSTAPADIPALMLESPLVSAADDEYTTDEDTVLTIAAPGILANDSVPEGGALTASMVSTASNGTLTVDGSGAFVYTPNTNFSGADTFVYSASDNNGGAATATVTINVLSVNDAPVATEESYVFTPAQTSVVDAPGVLANDSDPDGDVITATLVTDASGGSVTLAASGQIEYTPNPDFTGGDFFEYQAIDSDQARSGVTRVDIVVLPQTVANDDVLTGVEDQVLELAQPGVLGNDAASTAAENLVASVVEQPSQGTVNLQPDGTLSYEPALDFFGVDSFVYQALDTEAGLSATATVEISIAAVNDVPEAIDDSYQYVADEGSVQMTIDAPGVLTNDSDVDGDSLSAEVVTETANGALILEANGAFTYTPNVSFTGTDTFTYNVSDNDGASASASVMIEVPPANAPPAAVADIYAAVSSQTLTVAAPGILANDTDPEGDTLTVDMVASTQNGDLTLQDSGAFVYVADTDFTGTDFFEYQAVDGSGQRSAVTRVDIVVSAAPQAGNDFYSVAEDAELTVSAPGVLANDSAPESMQASLSVSTEYGSLTLNDDGSFAYTPNPDYFGADSFTYDAFDSTSGLTSTATVSITVDPVNDAPIAGDDSFATAFESMLNASVAGNDSDVDGDALEAVLNQPTANGTVQLNADGTFSYQPNPGFSGTDTFTYNVTDQVASSNEAGVVITVSADPGTGNPVNPDMLVRLSMDDELFPVTDSSGYGNNGVASGALSYSTETADSSFRSLQFNGQNTSVNLGPVDVDGAGLTMAAWFNASSFPGNSRDPRIMSKATSSAANDHIFMLGTTFSNGETRLRARVRTGGQTVTLVAPLGFEILTDQWYHAAATYDGSFVRLYLNATEIASTPLTGVIDQDPGIDVTVGSQPDGSKPFDGLIDAVHLFQRPLSVPELADLAGVELLPVAGSGVYDSDFEVTYKEYWISHEWFTGLDDCADSPTGGKWFIEPYGEDSACPMYFDIPDDISGALRAEVYMDIWRGRDTRSVRFNLNGNETRRPTVGSDWSRTPYVGEIPLSEISQGTNVLNLWRGGGQFHVHDIAIRVYHNEENLLIENGAPVIVPQANMVSITDDNGTNSQLDIPGVLDIDGDKLTLTAYASRDAKFIEFHAYYDGYDEDNDGKTLDWHNRTRNNWHPGGRSPRGTGGTIDHIGSVLVGAAGEYSVDWDIPWLPAQSNVRFKVRVVDGDGNVRDAAGGTTAEFELVRRTTRVETFTIPNFEDNVLWAAGNAPETLDQSISLPADLSEYTEAMIIASYWNNPDVSINGNAYFSAFTGSEDWQLSIRSFPVSYLVPGENTLTYRHDRGYGEFIEKPGPMIVLKGDAPTGPVAIADAYTLTEDTVLDVAAPGVLLNDSDPDGIALTAELVSSAANGEVGLSPTGAFLYTPDADFVGTDAFTYAASNGSVSSGAVTVTITVTPGNDAPVTTADSYNIAPDVTFSLGAPGVLGNDSDPDGDQITAELVTGAESGAVTIATDGSVEYTPVSGFNGMDSFTYQAIDSLGLRSAVTLVELYVTPPPVAVDDLYTVTEDNTLDVPAPGVLDNDTDTEGADNLSVSVVQQSANGTVRLQTDGSVIYTPVTDFFGVDEFTYAATDPDTGVAATATVTINVVPVNDAPVAVADTFTTPFGSSLEASVVANDYDPDGDQLSVSVVQEPAGGVVQMDSDGSFTYDPANGFEGEDSFTYTLSDSQLLSDEATVTVTVSAEGGITDPDLLVRLTMDDALFPVTDSSGYGNNGDPVGALSFSDNTADESTHALDFNGANTSVDLGPIDTSGSGLTMAAWFNARSFPGGARDPRILSKADGSAANDHVFMLGTIKSGATARLRTRVRTGNTTITLVAPTSTALDTNRWYHAAATYDGAVVRLYLDGEEIASRALAGAVAVDPAVDVAVGSQPDGSKAFDGLLDDVQLLQRAMTPDEVAYAAGDDSVFLPVIPTAPTDLRSIELANNRTDLSWTASVDNTGVEFYEIYRDGVLQGTSDGTEWTDATAGLAGTVEYIVVAVDKDGNRSVSASVTASIPGSDEGPWWDSSWPYRIQAGVDSGVWARQDRVVSIAADFDQLIVDAGGTEAFDTQTLRCHEVDRDGSILVEDVYCQAPNADVVSIWMTGSTPANTTRYYHAYFDEIGGASSASALPPVITTTTGVVDENQIAVRISTPAADFFYQLDAAGFSSLVDTDGVDWIGFNEDNVGANGTFRGIPNLVPPGDGGHFHPGADSAVTTIEEQGPIRTRLVSETTDGLWKVSWDITPSAATLTVLRNNANYWFLYEGTPGGFLDNADSTVRSTGPSSELPALTSWQGDLEGDEWVVVTGAENGRALYFAHHQSDSVEDSYRPASATQGNMTILGFGRTNNIANFESAGEIFSMGLLADQNFTNSKSVIESQVKPLAAAHSSAVASQ